MQRQPASGMKRSEIWTVAAGQGYAGKPRPAVILQEDRFDATDSITVCPFTTDRSQMPLFRLPIEPSDRNGLKVSSYLMVDKISTIPRTKLGTPLGRLDDKDMMRLNRAVLLFLGLAD
jgi:mRNA interferase MazF